MAPSIKRSDIKSTLQSIMGIGSALYVSNQVVAKIVTWNVLEATLVKSDWRQRNIDSARVEFNKIAY